MTKPKSSGNPACKSMQCQLFVTCHGGCSPFSHKDTQQVQQAQSQNLWKPISAHQIPCLSATFLAGHGEIATHRPAHNMPIHMDLGPLQRKPYKKSMWIGVLWAGLRHVDHPCGWQISPWLARKVTESTFHV